MSNLDILISWNSIAKAWAGFGASATDVGFHRPATGRAVPKRCEGRRARNASFPAGATLRVKANRPGSISAPALARGGKRRSDFGGLAPDQKCIAERIQSPRQVVPESYVSPAEAGARCAQPARACPSKFDWQGSRLRFINYNMYELHPWFWKQPEARQVTSTRNDRNTEKLPTPEHQMNLWVVARGGAGVLSSRQ